MLNLHKISFALDQPEAEYFLNRQALSGYKLGDGYPGTCEQVNSVEGCTSLAQVNH